MVVNYCYHRYPVSLNSRVEMSQDSRKNIHENIDVRIVVALCKNLANAIASAPGEGTTVTASYNTGHIDMVPIGDMSETVLLLIYGSPHLDFLYSRKRDSAGYTLDTRQVREALGGDVPLNDNDVAQWLREYLAEQESENLS